VAELVIFVVTGLSAGAVYALAGVGLVLTYKTSGVFNFAHGALATVAAYAFFELSVSQGWSWPLAAFVSVVVVGTIMGLVLEPFARRLRSVSLPVQVAATVGLLLAVQAVVALAYPDEELRKVPQYLPEGGFTLLEAPVQWSDVVTCAFALVATVVLSIVLRRTRAGAMTRALVDDDQLLSLNGISPNVVRRGAWIVGAILAAASGVLFAPLLALNSLQLTLLIVAAFGAAAVGRFSSLPLTFVGGLAIGVLASLATRYVTDPVFAGLAPSLPFVVLFAVILLSRRRSGGGHLTAPPVAGSGAAWRAPGAFQVGLAVVVIGFLATVPAFAGIRLTEWSAALGAVVVFLSLGLLVRTSGQVSLCHVSFMAIGAAAFSHFAVGDGVPWLLALVAAGFVAVPVGALLAVPAIRLSGLHLALATFGFGILLQYMFYTRDFMFGATGEGLPMPRPQILGAEPMGDTAYYYVALVLTVIAAAAVVTLTRSRLGRLLRGLGGAPTALETTGAAVNVTRVLVFCVSAFLAAVGGAMMGVARTTVSAGDFPPLQSLVYLTLIMIIVGREPWNAVVAGAALLLVPSYVAGGDVPLYLQLLFGASAVVLAVLPLSAGGPPPAVRQLVERVAARPARQSTTVALPTPRRERPTGSGLAVIGVTVRFGGLTAVSSVDLAVPLGQVTGLIGPNGAGKTTLFNAASGLVRPSDGRIVLNETDLTRRRPGDRARLGLGRTFQDMRLFEQLTVAENVALGREGSFAGRNPLSHLIGGPTSARAVRDATAEALDLCGLSPLADRPVYGLSTGQRRLVDLARCLAGSYSVLLLDEPSSGLDVAETAQLGEVVKRVVAERGVGVLLVEHDLPLVLDLCSRIAVLDFGRLIFSGTPPEVVASPIVKAAYLGDASLDELLDDADQAVVSAR